MHTNARRLFASILVAGALVPAGAAQASATQETCDAGLERLEQRFREIEERRGWYAAAEWWDKRWQTYYERCLAP